ncbi:MAG: sulfatase [Rikenellaceae bacterium]
MGTVYGGVSASHCASHSNVLLILVDDFGWNDLGCMGSKYYESPNIDKLAERGIRFTSGYSACSVSSPSRASLMTGKATPRHGITSWIGDPAGVAWRGHNFCSKMLPPEYAQSLPLSEVTIAEKLKECGYTTFMAGKWHLGDEGSAPEDHGFDINIGGYEGGGPRGGYFSPYNNPKLPNINPGEQLSKRLADETVNFMRNNHNKPFFAYLSFYAVHGAIQTTEERWRYFRDKAERMGIASHGFEVDRTLPVRVEQDNPVYAGLIADMDSAVGIVLDELYRLGIADDTLVIFLSDNGGVVSGDSFSTCLTPLRGGKGRQWEGGTRTPFIIYNPKHKGGRVDDTPVIAMDIYPTILDYVGAKQTPEQHIDGVSLSSVVSGEGELAERSLFWHYPHYGNQGGEPSSTIRRGDWKLIYYWEDSRSELYNLSIDISESEPLNHLYPERVESLRAELMEWLKQTNARRPVADPQYDPKAEHAVKVKWRTKTLEYQERMRALMLKSDWRPNATWWDSQPKTID